MLGMWDQHTTWATHYNLAYKKGTLGERPAGQNGKNAAMADGRVGRLPWAHPT